MLSIDWPEAAPFARDAGRGQMGCRARDHIAAFNGSHDFEALETTRLFVLLVAVAFVGGRGSIPVLMMSLSRNGLERISLFAPERGVGRAHRQAGARSWGFRPSRRAGGDLVVVVKRSARVSSTTGSPRSAPARRFARFRCARWSPARSTHSGAPGRPGRAGRCAHPDWMRRRKNSPSSGPSLTVEDAQARVVRLEAWSPAAPPPVWRPTRRRTA
jgi:hypothetical protein